MRTLFFLLIVLIFSGTIGAQQVIYSPSDEIIINPERGFYAHKQSTNAATLLDKDNLISLRENEGISLILMIYYLKDFIDSPISSVALSNIETNFNTMREAGVKCVLRFAYTWNQNSPPFDPPVAMAETHISQLTPVLRSGSDVIAVVQAGFIGVWGEWYYTTNFGFPNPDFDKRNKVVDGLLTALPDRKMIQLRTPVLKYGICAIDHNDVVTAETAFSGTKTSRIGHHNDCFLANETDYGTYVDIETDKAFLEAETLFLPMGGETCNPSSYSECANSLEQMQRFHWSYLNSDYHLTVLNEWVVNGCMPDIKKKLGYRFVLDEGQFTDEAKPGGCFSVDIKLTNQGWAAPFNLRDVEIILKKIDGDEKYWIRLPENPQFWLPEEQDTISHIIKLPETISEGSYQIFMNLPDPEPDLFDRPEYSIQLANQNTWDPETGYNDLLSTLEVTSSASSGECNTSLTVEPFPRIPHLEKITSVNQYSIATRVRLYPNPVTPFQDLTIEFNAGFPEKAEIQIISFSGQVLIKEPVEIHPGYNKISLTSTKNLSTGLYLAVIAGTTHRYSASKFTLQK